MNLTNFARGAKSAPTGWRRVDVLGACGVAGARESEPPAQERCCSDRYWSGACIAAHQSLLR
eukprot:1393212-Rhodomonas_salina.1